jgi:hypothetical protein
LTIVSNDGLREEGEGFKKKMHVLLPFKQWKRTVSLHGHCRTANISSAERPVCGAVFVRDNIKKRAEGSIFFIKSKKVASYSACFN